jgi:hypothetical protein
LIAAVLLFIERFGCRVKGDSRQQILDAALLVTDLLTSVASLRALATD